MNREGTIAVAPRSDRRSLIEIGTRAAKANGGEAGPERRTCAKLVRFGRGELATVTLRASECGRPVACYIRETALGAALHTRHVPIKDSLIRELARLGNELTVLVREARDRQLPTAREFERALGVLLTTINSIE